MPRRSGWAGLRRLGNRAVQHRHFRGKTAFMVSHSNGREGQASVDKGFYSKVSSFIQTKSAREGNARDTSVRHKE
ncbi:hypothetical protein ColKHC_03792 [Colletotrichum higginsianum]|nr:hypothetical protein ColKHC_03792 [Colletotrichum higginsianum]